MKLAMTCKAECVVRRFRFTGFPGNFQVVKKLLIPVVFEKALFSADPYLLTANNGNIRTMCKIRKKLTTSSF